MNTEITTMPEHTLIGKWNLYYHLPHDKKWDLSSYKAIISDLDSISLSAKTLSNMSIINKLQLSLLIWFFII